MLLFVEITVHGAIDMFAGFDNFNLCTQFLNSDRHPFKSLQSTVVCTDGVLAQWTMHRICHSGFYSHLVSADFFDDDAAFYRITSMQPGPFAKLLWHLVYLPTSPMYCCYTILGNIGYTSKGLTGHSHMGIHKN